MFWVMTVETTVNCFLAHFPHKLKWFSKPETYLVIFCYHKCLVAPFSYERCAKSFLSRIRWKKQRQRLAYFVCDLYYQRIRVPIHFVWKFGKWNSRNVCWRWENKLHLSSRFNVNFYVNEKFCHQSTTSGQVPSIKVFVKVLNHNFRKTTVSMSEVSPSRSSSIASNSCKCVFFLFRISIP